MNCLTLFMICSIGLNLLGEAKKSGDPSVLNGACSTMKPAHQSNSQTTQVPVDVSVNDRFLQPGKTIEITLTATRGSFKGFMVQVRANEGSDAVGEFINPPELTGVLCQGNSAISHRLAASTHEYSSLKVQWKAPTTFTSSTYRVFFTIVESFSTFWTKVDGPQLTYSGAISATSPPVPSNNEQLPPFVTADCGQTKGCYRNPEGCITGNCETFASWKQTKLNGQDAVEFELSGKTGGWVAIGFSHDQAMGDDYVLMAYKNRNTGQVIVHNRRNDGKSNRPVVGNPTEGILDWSATEIDGEIRARFTRKLVVSGSSEVWPLDKPYTLLLGTGNQPDPGAKHDKTPSLSPEKVPVSSSLASIGGSSVSSLIKVHGIFMITGWVLLASTAIIMARYYKALWPNDRLCRERVWFAVHRFCMLTNLILVVLAFILIFIHVQGYSSYSSAPEAAHPILGIIVTILCLCNPIMALFRCHPGTPNRPIFNWCHWAVGSLGHILAVPTIFIGINFDKVQLPSWLNYIMIIFVIWHVFIEIILEVHSCMVFNRNKRKQEDFELKREGDPNLKDKEPEPVGRGFKMIVLSLYCLVVFILWLVMVVIIAMA